MPLPPTLLLRQGERRQVRFVTRAGFVVAAHEHEPTQSSAAISLPDEGELKKLARYRKLLEEGLQRRLLALEQMRKMNEGRAAEQGSERAKEFRVKLRLVH